MIIAVDATVLHLCNVRLMYTRAHLMMIKSLSSSLNFWFSEISRCTYGPTFYRYLPTTSNFSCAKFIFKVYQ